MERPVENYIQEARRNGLSDDHIKEYLVKAGWVAEQVEPLLAATPKGGQEVEQHKSKGFSLRSLPEKVTDKIWNTFKN